ncbi:MAG: glycosyl transferase family 1, partial [Thermoprotei archaeon]
MVKIGFIGCGGIARLHMSNLAKIENVEIVAHTDVDIRKAEETARLYGGRAYSSYRDMLNREDLDAVYVCTPPFAHGFEVEVVEKGIHLFVEKPVAMKIDVAKEVLKAIQRYGVINSVGYMLRYLETTERMRRMASESTIGMVLGFYIDNFWLPPNHWVLD